MKTRIGFGHLTIVSRQATELLTVDSIFHNLNILREFYILFSEDFDAIAKIEKPDFQEADLIMLYFSEKSMNKFAKLFCVSTISSSLSRHNSTGKDQGKDSVKG